uniref:Calx-beta domain-containing protein n=1 Tax=Amphimedon queenslandica TaxID=400682 RepID=A0A1X7UQX6_AMPQE
MTFRYMPPNNLLSFSLDTVNSIDTIGRLKGIPSIHTNEGNKFCFSFLQNYEENTINILGIYIGTQENEEVQYSIKSRINGVARIGTVKPGQIKEELYQYTSYSNFETDLSFNPPRVKGMVPLRSISDYTGIIVETVDSSHKISVMGFSDGAKTSDGFTAVPMVDMSNIISTDYQYSVFTAGGKDSSIAAITTCDDFETAENVTVDATLVSQQGSFLPFNGSTLPFQSHYTSVITGSDDLLSSINVIATQPIGFMTGHECSKIPIDQVGCDHLIEQVPPSYTWGYNFLTAPFHTNNFGYILKLLPGKDFGTNFKIFCTINATVTVDTTVKNFVRTDRLVANRGIFSITTQSYCTIQSNKPLAVMQYATSHPANDSNSVPITSVDTIKNIGDPAMVWVPAVSQYLNKYLITNDVSIRSQSFTSNGIYVTVLPHCFNASAILDNGIPLENNASNWDTFHCDDVTDICGYGVSLDILQGTHLLKHIDSSCSFGAIMFGWGYKKGYAYPAGFGMRPIGVTFYSIEPLISSAPESGLVSVTVYRSGDLSEASSVQVGAFMSSKPNAATIGEDLESRTETVYFVANEFSATVNFTFINDYLPEQDEVFDVKFVNHHKINIGTPQVQELTILGDSPIVTGGGSSPGTGPNVVVQEGDSEVKVCITLSGLADSSYPEPVEFLFTPMEKSEALQPAQDEDYDNTTIAVIMPPGDTEVCAHISTVEDMIYNEPNEQFCINVTSNVSVGIFYPAQCQITVTIIDIGTRGSIDISRRLKGIPKSNTTEGNRFCLSFFEPPIPTIFLIKIGTLESFPVKYHISSGVNGINKTNTVEPGSINTEQYRYIPGNNESRFADDEPLIANMTIDFFNSRDINDFTGIEIKTVNSSHKISVTCFSKTTIRDDILYPAAVDSFVAVPIFNVGSIAQQYNYSMFNQYGNDDLYSQTVAAIVACDTIAAGGITLGYSNTSIPGHYFGTLDQRGLRSSQIKFKKYYTPYIPSSPAGTDVYATQPIGFMIGHTCLFYKSYYCDYLIEQVPPSYTWGYNFLIGPFRSLSMYSTILKFLPSKEIGTNFKIFCANSTSVTINVLVQNFTKADHMVSNRGIFNIGLQDYCTVQSNKPLAVMLYLELFQLIRKSIPDMVWIPPVSQYLNRYLVTIDATSYSFYRGVYVTVLPHCFDASAVLDNGIPLESNASNWHTFHCDNITDSCGYGIPVHMRQLGTHLLEHTDPSCSFGAIMFDFRYGKGYAYPAGFGMRPIGVTFYSIEPLISSAPESGLVSVNVYRSGDVSEASSVQVGTFMSSKSNAAMIGEDLESQTKTINFAANEFLATVNFSFLSDSVPELDEVFLVSFVEHQNINIGTPSEVELTILGVESNILKFTADNYCVHEGNTSVYVCVEKSRDTVDSVSLKITAMEDSIPSAAENIFDFVAETKTIDFPGPSKQACAQFQIIQDPFVDFKESIETFNVNFTATGDLGSGQMMATDKSIVTIYESLPEIFADSISGANNVFVPESQENVTVCVNRTFNFSCTRNVTFRAMDSALSINAKSGSDFVAETKEMPFTSDDLRVCAKFIIINDDIVEKNESFLITVMAQDHIPTVLTINITITDEDDAAVISFTNDTYTFPENIDLDAQVCVETTKELSDDIRINFTTRSSDFDGAATADSDYISKSETKTLRSGSRTVCINIEIKPDVTREPTEFFYVQLEVLNLVELMNNSYYGPSRLNVSDSEPAVVYITDTSVTGCESVYADLILLISESSNVHQYKAIMSLSDDFYDRLNESEFINGTIQQLVKDINYNLSGRIIGNFTLFFIELLNSDEIYPDDDPENVSLLITLIANNQTNWLNQHIADDLGNLLGSTITDVVRFDGCPTSSTTLLSDSGDPKLTLTIKWPETNIGEIAVVNCPCGSNGTSAGGTLNASRNCGGDFTNGALWQAPSVLKCKLRDLARMICQLKDRLFPGVSYASVIDMLKELKSITSNSSEIGYTEVAAVVSVLEAAAEFANTIAENTMLITSLFEVIDNILAVNQEILIECQALSNSSSRILAIISNMAAIINVTDASTSRHVIKSHRYFAVSVYKSNFEGFGGQTLSINLTDFSESNVNSYNITLEPEGNIVSSTGSVTLPSNILNSSNINRITNAVYFTDSLFLRRRSNYFDHDVSSIVISASILRDFNAIKELESPVNLSFQLNPNINGSFPQCVFWDQSLNSGYGDWSSDNCNTSYDSVTQAIKCFCNHLTSFAVIQDVSPTEPSTEFRVYYLDSVSYIGIIISIICLIITIVLYLYNKDLRLSNHSQMLLNHCFALIGLYLSFVTSIHARNINSFCAVSGFMLQFFFLVCLSLMSAEVIGLYINIVMNSYMKMFYIKVTLVSWIAPIFIVIFCFSPSYTNYIKYSSNFCRAFDTPFYIGIVIPFIITYSFIWIVFIIIVISLLMSSKIKDSNKKTVLKPSYKYQLTKSLAHSTLFCLSSVLMLLMTEDTFTNKAIRDLVASLFVLLTGCHGLFLFIVHCLCTKDFYCICKKVSFGIKSLLLHTVQKKPSESTDRIFDDTMESTNQYLETILNSNMCQENISSNLEQLVKYSISASQIKLQEAVGQGEFGIVYRAFLATDKDIPQVVAVKTLKGLFSRSDVTSIVEESLIMSNFDHPNVLSLIGVSLDLGPAPCIIMPFMSRGSLLSYLKNDRLNITITDGNDEEIILNVRKHLLSICLQVANGMCYLASKYFVHRDLAARNCMIDNNGVIKVADFGLSEEVYTKTYFNQFKDKSDAESVKLPIKWMCPNDRPLFSELNTSINALIDPLAQYLSLQL